MIEEAFEVATEFRFDVGQAMINTNALKGAVDDLSKAADSGLANLNYLAGGLVAHLGFGSGGLLTVLSRAVELSEEFNVGTMGFVNSISSNMRVLQGTIYNFNDELGTSKMLMTDVSNTATKFGIPTQQLTQLTQTFAGPLSARGKLGTNYSNAIELGKNSLIASEATGLHPMMIQEALLRAMNPGQGFGGKIFERLMNTNAFRDARIIHPAQGAMMNQDKKIDLVIKAMSELGNNADYLAARTNSLRISFNMLKGQIESLIKPIGDAIGEPIKKIFHSISTFLSQNGAAIGKNIADFISNIFEDPKRLFVNLLQLKELGGDFRKSIHIAELFGVFRMIKFLLDFLGIELNGGLLKTAMSGLFEGVMWVVRAVPWMKVISGGFKLLRIAIADFVAPFAAALIILQGISRAKAIAKVDDMAEIPALVPRMSSVLVRWKNVLTAFMSPIQQIIEEIGQLLAPIFKTSNYFKIFVSASEVLLPELEALSNSFVALAGDVHGFAMGVRAEFDYLFNLPGNIINALTSSNPITALKDALFSTVASDTFSSAKKDFLEKNSVRLGQPGDSSSKYVVTNNNHIEARFDMREQLEPDRVAFAVTTHLKKLALNPTQGRGGSIAAAFAGNQGDAGFK